MDIFELLITMGRISFILGTILILGGLLLLLCSIIAFLPAGFIPGPVGMILSIPTSIFAIWLFGTVVKDTVINR